MSEICQPPEPNKSNGATESDPISTLEALDGSRLLDNGSKKLIADALLELKRLRSQRNK